MIAPTQKPTRQYMLIDVMILFEGENFVRLRIHRIWWNFSVNYDMLASVLVLTASIQIFIQIQQTALIHKNAIIFICNDTLYYNSDDMDTGSTSLVYQNFS